MRKPNDFLVIFQKLSFRCFLTFTGLGITLINLNYPAKLSAQIIGNQQVTGNSGGGINSQDCGYIASQPNHVLNLMQKVDYLRVNLQANGGEPTLLILGPGAQDRFCVLGDRSSGVNPELAGVWEAGKYLIYVGDLSNSQHSFTLNISTQK